MTGILQEYDRNNDDLCPPTLDGFGGSQFLKVQDQNFIVMIHCREEGFMEKKAPKGSKDLSMQGFCTLRPERISRAK